MLTPYTYYVLLVRKEAYPATTTQRRSSIRSLCIQRMIAILRRNLSAPESWTEMVRPALNCARALTFCEIEFLDRAIRANGKHVRPHLLKITSNTSGSINSPRILMETDLKCSLKMALLGKDRTELMQPE